MKLYKPAADVPRTNTTPIDSAKKQYATYVSKRKNISIDEATKLVEEYFVKNPPIEPRVEHYVRGINGDKHIKYCTLSEYIDRSKDNILLPTFTQYYPTSVLKSETSQYVQYNLKMRKETKKELFSETDQTKYERLDREQKAWKGRSNDVTGLFRSIYSPVYSPSCHTSLTSLSRVETSTANGNSERLLEGRQHFHTYEITINTINSIVSTLTSESRLSWKKLLDNKLVTPTADDCYRGIIRSTYMYWNNDKHKTDLYTYIKTLDGIERAAIHYSGSAYAVRELNPEYFRTFLDRFTVKDTDDAVNTDDLKNIRGVNDEILNYIHHRFSDSIIGLGNNYNDYPPLIVSQMYRTACNVYAVMSDYFDDFCTIFAHSNLPPAVYDIYTMVRDSVIMSDTDSCTNTLQNWVQWYHGSLRICEDSTATSNAMVYLCNIVLKVYIKQVGRNINMTEEQLDRNVIEFKSEFCFLVFGLMSIAKHYFAGVNIREGSVFKRKLEIKGGSLKSHSISATVKADASVLIERIIDGLELDGKISLYVCLEQTIKLECSIINDIRNGGHKYIRTLNVSIDDPESLNYQYYTFWNDVWADKYKFKVSIPFLAQKYPTCMSTKGKLQQWVDSIEDKTLRGKLIAWLEKHNKKMLNILYVPTGFTTAYPLPDEMLGVIEPKRLALDLVNMEYIILESLGFYKKPTLLLSEMFPEIARGYLDAPL